jgi:replication factor C subunit 2/4
MSNKIIEPIQSRCAMIRYSKLSDKEILKRLMEICEMERVNYIPEGLEAIIFTAEGDMRQAVNNLQSTFAGFGMVNPENVFKVCDQPHPTHVHALLKHAVNGEPTEATDILTSLWNMGYSTTDIISTLFKVCKSSADIPEFVKLEFIKVFFNFLSNECNHHKEIGMTHMRVLEGNFTLLQLAGLVARLCKITIPPEEFKY